MKAISIDQYGEPDVLHLKDVELPAPIPGSPAQKLQIVVEHAGDSPSVKPRWAAWVRTLAISRSRARGSSSAALKSRHGSRCRSGWATIRASVWAVATIAALGPRRARRRRSKAPEL
jgi:hypothetical protein